MSLDTEFGRATVVLLCAVFVITIAIPSRDASGPGVFGPGRCQPVRREQSTCTLDRFIQQAILQVLQPRFDPTFSEHSHGFRPGRSAHDAVRAARKQCMDGRLTR